MLKNLKKRKFRLKQCWKANYFNRISRKGNQWSSFIRGQTLNNSTSEWKASSDDWTNHLFNITTLTRKSKIKKQKPWGQNLIKREVWSRNSWKIRGFIAFIHARFINSRVKEKHFRKRGSNLGNVIQSQSG